MDEPMVMIYKLMYHLDVSRCIKFEGDPDMTEINIDDKMWPLQDFVKNTINIVTIDQILSTRDVAESVAKSGLEDFKNRFIALYRHNCILLHKSEPAGYLVKSVFYNGFPRIVDTHEGLDLEISQIDSFMDKYLKNLEGVTDDDLLTVPVTGITTPLFLLPEYNSKLVPLPVEFTKGQTN